MKTKTNTTTKVFALLTVITIGLNLSIAFGNQNGKPATKSVVKTSITTTPISQKASVNLADTVLPTKISVVNPTNGINKYEYSGQSTGVLTLSPGENSNAWLDLRNTGNTTWDQGTFHLGTYRTQDRNSSFTNFSWLSTNRIGMKQTMVTPGNNALFSFNFTAPTTSGVYYEYFRPVIDGTGWMDDIGIFWKITIKNPGEDESKLPVFNKIGEKRIVITISNQNLKCYEGNDVVCDILISSGTYALPTPIGNFKILSKSPVAYSAAYGLYMNYWMPFYGGYGIHELPYWKYSWGIVTEGANHLGQRVSHGCVRMGIGSAKQVYDWANIGTPVEIIN